MSNDEFEWKGVRFAWNHHRAALKGNVILSGKTYWLLVREQGGRWESWCEFEGGYTQACTMAYRYDALDGTLIALKDFLQATILALNLLMGKAK
jgi:hypothetical protein